MDFTALLFESFLQRNNHTAYENSYFQFFIHTTNAIFVPIQLLIEKIWLDLNIIETCCDHNIFVRISADIYTKVGKITSFTYRAKTILISPKCAKILHSNSILFLRQSEGATNIIHFPEVL